MVIPSLRKTQLHFITSELLLKDTFRWQVLTHLAYVQGLQVNGAILGKLGGMGGDPSVWKSTSHMFKVFPFPLIVCNILQHFYPLNSAAIRLKSQTSTNCYQSSPLLQWVALPFCRLALGQMLKSGLGTIIGPDLELELGLKPSTRNLRTALETNLNPTQPNPKKLPTF